MNGATEYIPQSWRTPTPVVGQPTEQESDTADDGPDTDD